MAEEKVLREIKLFEHELRPSVNALTLMIFGPSTHLNSAKELTTRLVDLQIFQQQQGNYFSLLIFFLCSGRNNRSGKALDLKSVQKAITKILSFTLNHKLSLDIFGRSLIGKGDVTNITPRNYKDFLVFFFELFDLKTSKQKNRVDKHKSSTSYNVQRLNHRKYSAVSNASSTSSNKKLGPIVRLVKTTLNFGTKINRKKEPKPKFMETQKRDHVEEDLETKLEKLMPLIEANDIFIFIDCFAQLIKKNSILRKDIKYLFRLCTHMLFYVLKNVEVKQNETLRHLSEYTLNQFKEYKKRSEIEIDQNLIPDDENEEDDAKEELPSIPPKIRKKNWDEKQGKSGVNEDETVKTVTEVASSVYLGFQDIIGTKDSSRRNNANKKIPNDSFADLSV